MLRLPTPYHLASPLLVVLLALTTSQPLIECRYEAATGTPHASEACPGHADASTPDDAADRPDVRCCVLTAPVPVERVSLTAPDAPRLDPASVSILLTGLTSVIPAPPLRPAPPDRRAHPPSARLHLVHAVLLI